MADTDNNDLYKVNLMRTLWENTYRGTIFDCMDHYVATVRLIFGIPLDRDQVPKDAPEVHPYITVLIEDTTLSPSDVIGFEEAVSKIIVKKAASQYFRPDRCMFFYPSPADAVPEKDDALKGQVN